MALRLGIMGGMGPEATEVMFRRIIERTDAKTDQEHLDMIIFNHASMPDRTEAIRSGHTERLVSLLKNDAVMLEKCGAAAIVIPCNTSHCFISEISDSVNIPVINMIEETAARIAQTRPYMKKVGIIATCGTIEQRLYHRALDKRGIEPFAPDGEIQKTVTDIIYEQIKRGENGSLADFLKVLSHLRENGCDGAILACTELSVLKTNYEAEPCFNDGFCVDAMEVLIDKSIEFCGGRIKK